MTFCAKTAVSSFLIVAKAEDLLRTFMAFATLITFSCKKF